MLNRLQKRVDVMMVEIPKERYIKNIGIRPHNLPYSQLIERIQSNEGNGQHGVLMLKPGCFLVDGRSTSIQNQTEELISSSGLDVVATSCVALTREQIHKLYPNVFGSDVTAITDRLDDLRILLEDYLSDCVFAYLVHGEDAPNKLKTIKVILRQNADHVGNWDIENLVHVPDQGNLTQDMDILFNNGCSACLMHKNE